MSCETKIQEQFFEQIRLKYSSNILMVNEISELLNLSNDSAYRRIRGEKPISLEELFTLSLHYNISIDSVFDSNTNNVTFINWVIDHNQFSFKDWLNSIISDMEIISGFEKKEIIYAAKDPPVFHIWNIPEIAAFKVFFWQKTLLQLPGFAEQQYSFDEYDIEIQKIGEKILDLSLNIPIIEIWNEGTFNILLKQIEYYWVAGLFKHKEDIMILCDCLEKWVRHIQTQAKLGFNFKYGNKPVGIKNTYAFYENEVVLNDNTILVKIGEQKICYITYNVLNVLKTTNPAFTNSVHDHLKGIIKESSLISSIAAKVRQLFFNKLINNIAAFKNWLQTNDV